MFTWIPIYREIASRVLTFEQNRDELLSPLREMRERGLRVIPLADEGAGGAGHDLTDIDPFTFFASFNRGQRDDNRQAILADLKSRWGLTSEVPTDFAGIPIVHPMQSWFFYEADRRPAAIPALWRIARETVEKIPREFDRQLMRDYLSAGLGPLYKLTIGMFWLNPYSYLALDSRNRAYLEARGVRLRARTADAYFELLEEVSADDLPTISVNAYHHDAGGGGGRGGPRFWTLSAGEGGEQWQDFLAGNVVAIGWSELGDLRDYDDRDKMREMLRESGRGGGSMKNATLACWQFAREMKMGDIIFVKQGGRRLLGVARVTGDYEYRAGRADYKNVRTVEWLAKGSWELPEDTRVATKTLTDVTRFKDAVSRLLEITGVSDDHAPPPPPPTDRQYWWLNANSKIWDFDEVPVGQTQTYTTHNERGNKRQRYKYFAEVRPGDYVIGYVTSPQREVVAVCEITQGAHESGGSERIEFRKVEQLKNPVTYAELKSISSLAQSEPMINNQGSLFKLANEEWETIRALIDDKNPPEEPQLEPYTRADALGELFLDERELDEVVSRLRRKKNLIMQGPPGVGKTFVARRLAHFVMGVKDDSRVQMVQFHQSYSYEDFVQGFRPNDEGRFDIRNGVFYEFCRRARRDPGREYFFIIDEINRGNLSKIFGELLMLIEHDKRGPEYAVPLTYAKAEDELFFVPANVFVIGMMNTADRSLSLVDYALRRRFAFATLRPKYESEKFARALSVAGAPAPLIQKIRDRMAALNRLIAEDVRDYGPGYCIGHSYFCTTPDGAAPDEGWYREIVESELKPLLEEYWLDEPDKVEEHVARLLA